MYPDSQSLEHPWWRVILYIFLDTITLVGGIALALLVIRQVWLAVLLGSFFNFIFLQIYALIFNFVSGDELKYREIAIDFGIGFITVIYFALFYGIGWWITTDQTPTQETVKPRLSKEFFVGTWIAVNTITMILTIFALIGIAFDQWLNYRILPTSLLLLILILFSVYGAIVFLAFIYRMWSSIQDGCARATPGEAVGKLFIPVYNLFWIFQIFPGFATDYNDFVNRHRLNLPYLSSGLMTAYCSLVILSLIPVIGILISLVNFFVGIAMMSKICEAVNALPSFNTPPSDYSNFKTLNLG
jgi:hypothetical protein